MLLHAGVVASAGHRFFHQALEVNPLARTHHGDCLNFRAVGSRYTRHILLTLMHFLAESCETHI